MTFKTLKSQFPPILLIFLQQKTKVNRLDKLVEKKTKKLAKDVIKKIFLLLIYFLRSRYAQIFENEVHTVVIRYLRPKCKFPAKTKLSFLKE